MCALAFRSPEHETQHATCTAGSIWRDGLNVASGAVLERCAEVVALRRRVLSGDNVQAAGKSVRSKWWHRGRVVGLAVNVLLPVTLCGRRTGWLFIGNHCIGVIEHGRRVVQPISRGISGN